MNQKTYSMLKIFALVVGFVLLSLFVVRYFPHQVVIHQNETRTAIVSNTQEKTLSFVMPISDAKNRITKKHFGTYVTPKNSPVNPEVFTGYHTAVDFETFESEQKSDVPVYAICTGKVLEKRTANGYGGMVVTSCMLDGDPITVVYGHVRLSDMKAEIGDNISTGDFLTNLGDPYSKETGGERKHLHLGIHKGSAEDTRGYIANKSDLKNWIDFEQYAK